MSVIALPIALAPVGELVQVAGVPAGLHLQPDLASMGGFSSGLAELVSQMRREAMSSMPKPLPANPCLEDLRRLHCTDAACLKRSADELVPACASFLLGPLQPSPAPDTDADPKPAGKEAADKAAMERRTAPSGFFSFSSTGADGQVHRISGPLPSSLSSLSPSSLAGPRFSPLLPLGMDLPFGLANLLTDTTREMVAAMEEAAEEEEEEEEEEAMAQHPCKREIDSCIRLARTDDRDAIKDCLVRNIERLTPSCKCFVHQLTGHAPRAVVAPAAPATAAPAAAAAAAPHAPVKPTASVRVVMMESPEEPLTMVHPLHRLSCVFLLTSLFLLMMLLVRSCVLACAAPHAAKRVVIVPPAKSAIRTQGGLVAVVESSPQPVQVAEPLSKA